MVFTPLSLLDGSCYKRALCQRLIGGAKWLDIFAEGKEKASSLSKWSEWPTLRSLYGQISLATSDWTRLQCTQNKVIRFLLNAPARTHIGLREFRLVNMLPVELRVKQLKLNLVYNIINDRAPRYLSNYINVSCKQHGINTRSSSLSLSSCTVC